MASAFATDLGVRHFYLQVGNRTYEIAKREALLAVHIRRADRKAERSAARPLVEKHLDRAEALADAGDLAYAVGDQPLAWGLLSIEPMVAA